MFATINNHNWRWSSRWRMRLARDIVVECAIASSSFDPWHPLFIICIFRFRTIHPSTGREKKEFLIELELRFTIMVFLGTIWFHDRNLRMTRRWNFFFYFIRRFIRHQKSICIDSQLNSSVHQKKKKKNKKFPLLVRIMILQTFFGTFAVLGHAQLDHRHHAIIIPRP